MPSHSDCAKRTLGTMNYEATEAGRNTRRHARPLRFSQIYTVAEKKLSIIAPAHRRRHHARPPRLAQTYRGKYTKAMKQLGRQRGGDIMPGHTDTAEPMLEMGKL